MTTEERIAQIKERLTAISTKVSVTIEAGDSMLKATADAPSPGEYDRFTNSFIEFVETAADVTLEDRNVVIADDEDGQDLTFHLHAREDVPWLLDQLAEARDKLDTARANLEEQGWELVATGMDRDGARTAAAEATLRMTEARTAAEQYRTERDELRESVTELQTALEFCNRDAVDESKTKARMQDRLAKGAAERDQLAATIARVRTEISEPFVDIDTDPELDAGERQYCHGWNDVAAYVRAALDGQEADSDV